MEGTGPVTEEGGGRCKVGGQRRGRTKKRTLVGDVQEQWGFYKRGGADKDLHL